MKKINNIKQRKEKCNICYLITANDSRANVSISIEC